MIEKLSKWSPEIAIGVGAIIMALYNAHGSNAVRDLVLEQFRPQEIAAPVQDTSVDCSQRFLLAGYELTCALDTKYFSDKV